MQLENDVDDPERSCIFSNHPEFLRDGATRDFVCDSRRMPVIGATTPHELDQLMDLDIEVQRRGRHDPVNALSAVAEALQRLGIVAVGACSSSPAVRTPRCRASVEPHAGRRVGPHAQPDRHRRTRRFPPVSNAGPSSGYSNWALSSDRANAARRLPHSYTVAPDQVVEVRGFAGRKLMEPDAPKMRGPGGCGGW